MGDAAMVALFWNLHFLACFAGLAYLPFSKFFHILTGPLSLLVDAGMDMTRADPANVATRRMIELDACTHCGACTLRCSVGVCVEAVGNENLLPSEKLEPLRTLAAGGTLDSKALDALLEGLHFCTNCRRCSGVCPVGIDLQAMWAEVREDLLAKGGAEPLLLSQLALYRALSDDTESPAYKGPQAAARAAVDAAFPFDREAESVDMDQRDRAMQRTLRESAQGASFSYCFNCRTCSSSCPLPKEHEDPFEALDMLPHQIIHATALGLSSMAVGSRMLWSCLGCYRCQERCPQGVRVADVFFHLKNVALDRARNRQEAS
jgi:heterodisulfide reductase subunit C